MERAIVGKSLVLQKMSSGVVEDQKLHEFPLEEFLAT